MKKINFPADGLDRHIASLQNMVGAAPSEGYSIEDVRQSCKILDKIDKSNLEFEDAEIAFIQKRLSVSRFTLASQETLTFIDAIMSAA